MRAVIVLLALCVSWSAFAEDKPTGIDFNQVLMGINGEALFQPGDDCFSQQPDKSPLIPGKTCGKVDLTLSDVTVGALEAVLESDKNEEARKRFDRDQLARKVYKQKQISLTSEEVSIIKDRIGRSYGPAIIGAAWPLLDPALRTKP